MCVRSALRNAVRTCARYGITRVTLPLLFIDQWPATTTIEVVKGEKKAKEAQTRELWCQRRAELVFKCVKGFLMETVAYGSTSDITRSMVLEGKMGDCCSTTTPSTSHCPPARRARSTRTSSNNCRPSFDWSTPCRRDSDTVENESRRSGAMRPVFI